jgi:maleate isomerase
MTTVLANRAVFGVIIPSTNTVVEDEYNLLRVPGVSFHAGRILIRNEALDSDGTFEQFLEDLRRELVAAVENVVTAKPDHLVMGCRLRPSGAVWLATSVSRPGSGS